MKIKVDKNIFWLLAYKIMLDIIYVKIICPRYEYQGFTLSFSILIYLISCITSLLMVFEISRLLKSEKISDLLLATLYIIYFLPQLTFCSFTEHDLGYFSFVLIFAFLLIIMNKVLFRNTKLGLKISCSSGLFFDAAIVFFGIFMVGLSGIYTGFRVSMDISSFYDFRYEARGYDMPAVFRYAFSWAKIFIPIGVTYTIIKKKWLLSLFAVVSGILCFSFDGKKSMLAFLAMAVCVACFYKKKYLLQLPLMFAGLNFLTICEAILRGGVSIISNYIMRRVFFIPSYLGWAYYDYFSTHELDYLRGSILRFFGFESPYTQGIPSLIGLTYYGDAADNANTGLCGDAFSNFGWLSLLIYPILTILALKILDFCAENIDARVKIMVILSYAYTFINGSFFTIMLTNGFVVICMLMFVYPRRKKNITIRRKTC